MEGPVVAVVFAGLGVFLIFLAFKHLKLKRQVADLPTSKIRSMAMGLVEITGMAFDLQPLVDPIYGKPCAFYKVKVTERRGSGKRQRWVTVQDIDSGTVLFGLNDGSGKAAILPQGADLHFQPAVEARNGVFFATKDDAARSYLDQFGSFRERRLVAHIIRPGEPLYVLGYTQPQAQSRKGISMQEVGARIKSNPLLSKAIDTNGDGQVDAMEWEKGIQDVRKEMETERLQKELKAPPTQVAVPLPVVTKSPDGIFVFGRSQEDLTTKLGWYFVGELLGGTAAIAAAAVSVGKMIRAF